MVVAAINIGENWFVLKRVKRLMALITKYSGKVCHIRKRISIVLTKTQGYICPNEKTMELKIAEIPEQYPIIDLMDMKGDPATIAAGFVSFTHKHIFLTGNAGTGKTTFLRRLITETCKRTAIVAPTGIAALNAGGVTIHSLFQLPFGSFAPVRNLPPGHEMYGQVHDQYAIARNMRMSESRRALLRQLELLIIDEVSMLRADVLDAIDFVLRMVRKQSFSPFGGVQVLFIGDMLQLPPVVKEDDWKVLSAYYRSPFFFDALVMRKEPPVYVELEKIFRQSDPVFIDLLNKLRNNQMSANERALLNRHYDPGFRAGADTDIITLTTHNYKADRINKSALAQLGGKSYFYQAVIEGEFSPSAYPVEQVLELKTGAQVMFIKNDPTGQQRFFNGKIGRVIALAEDSIEVECKGEDKTIEVGLYEWENNRYTYDTATAEIQSEKIGSFSHYPIKLAWAITVHKSQGLTFERAILDVNDAFASGQIYVALSRLRSLDGLVLSSPIPGESINTDAHILEFAESKRPSEELQEKLSDSSLEFLRKEVETALDFKAVLGEIQQTSQHLAMELSKKKFPAEFARSTHFPDSLRILAQEAKDCSKACPQLISLGLSHLPEANAQFGQFADSAASEMENMCAEALKICVELAKTPGNKEAIRLLKEMDYLLFERSRALRKTMLVLQGAAEHRVPLRSELAEGEFVQKRKDLLERLKNNFSPYSASREHLKQANMDPEISKGRMPQARHKEKKAKPEKGSSHRESLALFRQGNTIEQIAALRNLTRSTIVGHLASFVGREVAITELVSNDTIEKVNTLLAKNPDIKISEAFALLGRSIGMDDIRVVMNAAKKLQE